MPSRRNNPNKKGNPSEISLLQKKSDEHRANRLIWIQGLSNEDLLVETLLLQGGDDWDGMFTKEGRWECDQLELELRNRLSVIGFL